MIFLRTARWLRWRLLLVRLFFIRFVAASYGHLVGIKEREASVIS